MKKNNVKRSTVAMVTALSIMALLLVSLTVAFLTDSRSTLNILGIGSDGDQRGVQVALFEHAFGSTNNANAIATAGGFPGEYDYVKLNGVMPGDRINQDSMVQNVGIHGVYVRVQLTDREGTVIDGAVAPYDKLEFEVSADWTYDRVTDCYYYTGANLDECKVLSSNESVEVFRNYGDLTNPYTMIVSSEFNNIDLEESGLVAIHVRVDAIQAENFEPQLINGINDPWNGEEILEVTNRWDGY